VTIKDVSIADEIRAARKAAGNPAQDAVAIAVGVTVRTYSRWENGYSEPRRDNVEALERYFGVSLGEAPSAAAAVPSVARRLAQLEETVSANQATIAELQEALRLVRREVQRLAREPRRAAEAQS